MANTRMKFRTGSVERYRLAFNDLVDNPGRYNTTEWTRKHRIGSQAVKSAIQLGVIERKNTRLYCTRSVIRVEMIETILKMKRVADMEFGARRIGTSIPVVPPPTPMVLPSPNLFDHAVKEVTPRRQVSILWGLLKYDL